MTTVKTTISLSEARRRIFEIAEEVQKPNIAYTFTMDGKPKVVMLSAEQYESLMETLRVLHHFPDLRKDLGFTVAERPKKEYGSLHRNMKRNISRNTKRNTKKK